MPVNAQDLNVFETDTRLESFVSRNQASAMAPKPTSKGLEIVAQAPLDSFKRGGTSSFVVLLDGKPAKDIEVLIASADVSNTAETILQVKTASDGSLVNHWRDAGSYLLTAQMQDQQVTLKPASKRRIMYGLTVSVGSN